MLRKGVIGLIAAVGLCLGGIVPLQAQQVTVGKGDTLSIHGFISGTWFWDRNQFGGFGQGQSAEWAAAPGASFQADKWFSDAEVSNTRLTLAFAGPHVSENWRVKAEIEADFFGGAGAPPFGDEQPHPRLRLGFADITNGRTTIRIGQFWSPLFGEYPQSLSHIAFPMGYGSAGFVGWRFPGVFLYQDLSPAGSSTKAQLQLAAMKGSGPAVGPSGIGNGEASAIPQFEARLNVGGKAGGVGWHWYAAGHVDKKDLSGAGDTTTVGTDTTGTTGWAVETGGGIEPGPFVLHGNFYYGQAIGQQFGAITQFGDIRSWGAWGQIGYKVPATGWSLWGYYGIDNPDETRYFEATGQNLTRLKNQIASFMIRYETGPYAIGVEWFKAFTDYQTAQTKADQIALSVKYNI
jgi:hypothetical protein